MKEKGMFHKTTLSKYNSSGGKSRSQSLRIFEAEERLFEVGKCPNICGLVSEYLWVSVRKMAPSSSSAFYLSERLGDRKNQTLLFLWRFWMHILTQFGKLWKQLKRLTLCLLAPCLKVLASNRLGRDDFHFLLPSLYGLDTTFMCYREKHVGLHGGSWVEALYPPRNHTLWWKITNDGQKIIWGENTIFYPVLR